MSRRVRLADVPMLLGCDGSVVLNALSVISRSDVDEGIAFARRRGLTLVVGFVVEGRLRRNVVRDINDAGFDIAFRLGMDLSTAARKGPRRAR